MKLIDLHQVDAFTDTLFGGNPAGVVTNADNLTNDEMEKIAREMNLSETAFVFAPTSDKADVMLRYFTSGMVELDFCGHATIAAVYELARLGMYGLDTKNKTAKIRVENGAGILDMTVSRNKSNDIRVEFIAPAVNMQPYHLQGKSFADQFGIPSEVVLPDSSILIDTVLNYMYIPIVSLSQLGDLQFDLAKISQNFQADNIIAFCLYTAETFDSKANLHTRVTCPLLGLAEDPFTGSTQSGLIHAAKKTGVVDEAKTVITTEQGHFMKRPSSVQITHEVVHDVVTVVASAVQVFSTKMEIQE